MQADLFARPLLPGLSTRDEVLSAAEERALITQIDAVDLTPFRFQGWTGRRLTASFGFHYDFDKGRLGAGPPFPAWIESLRERAARAAGLAASDLVQLLVTRYDPGAGIGWHRDRPIFETVVGVSLGAAATLQFRQRQERGFRRVALPLPPRSLYVLSGEAREAWEHRITPMAERRWSITLRSLRA